MLIQEKIKPRLLLYRHDVHKEDYWYTSTGFKMSPPIHRLMNDGKNTMMWDKTKAGKTPSRKSKGSLSLYIVQLRHLVVKLKVFLEPQPCFWALSHFKSRRESELQPGYSLSTGTCCDSGLGPSQLDHWLSCQEWRGVMIWCDQWWHPVVMCRSWCLLLHPAHLAPASPSLHLIRYDKLHRASTCKTITGDWSHPSHPSPSSCWTLAIKGDDVCFFAHLSSPLNCKHITLKTGLESQQMSNWRVNYHHAPLMSLSAALWLLSDGAVFFQRHFWGSPYSLMRSMPHRQTIISNRLWIFEHLQKKQQYLWL